MSNEEKRRRIKEQLIEQYIVDEVGESEPTMSKGMEIAVMLLFLGIFGVCFIIVGGFFMLMMGMF